MPGKSGLDILNDLKRMRPKMPILLLSMHPEEQYARRALKTGASGCLTKESVSSSRPKAKIPISSFGNTVVQKHLVDQICILRLRDALCSWVFRISTSEDSSSGGEPQPDT